MRGNWYAVVALCAASGAAVAALSPPVEEAFVGGSNGWATGAFAPAAWSSSGGPSGSEAFISSTGSFENKEAGGILDPTALLTVFRGETGPGSMEASGGAFVGNWLGAGVDEFSFWIRHDAPVSLEFWTRFAVPERFPGVVFGDGTLVNPGEWTQITYSGSFFAAFGDLGQIQIGALTNAGVAGDPATYTFDLALVVMTPAPGGLAALGFAGLLAGRRRR